MLCDWLLIITLRMYSTHGAIGRYHADVIMYVRSFVWPQAQETGLDDSQEIVVIYLMCDLCDQRECFSYVVIVRPS